jgi:hypothetical protein
VIREGDESRAFCALVRRCGCIGGVKGKHSTSIVTNINKRSISLARKIRPSFLFSY